ncbi:MAG TPA: DUF2630 family protein [Nitrospira sp.]|nr:DUF2630 family protein [Nitrospira sp.]
MEDQLDGEVLRRIEELVSQEHGFQEQELLSDDDRARLRGVQVELDQSWDLLRQRRALRAAGQDPNRAQVRPAGIVQKYVQ